MADPLRQGGLDVPRLSAHPANRQGKVVAALHHTVEDEARDIAERARAVWNADASRRARGQPGRTVAVLIRRRSQIDRIAYALRAAELPVEIVGVGGLLTTPAVSDVVATLRVLANPGRGDALMRLLTGSRWRIGPRDLEALGRWARLIAKPPDGAAGDRTGDPPAPDARDPNGNNPNGNGPNGRDPGPLAPEEPAPDEVDNASIVDALDALPTSGWLSPAGRERLTAFAAELRALRRRAAQPLVDLVADVVRTLGLDVEVAARTGEAAASRADLDAFLDVAVGFAESGEGASLPAFLAYLEAADAEERGLEPGQVEVAEERIQVLTVHGAKGLEWDVVFVPGCVEGVFPAAAAKDKAWLTDLGALPFPLRGDADALPVLDVGETTDQREVKEAFDRFAEECGDWARLEERRLAYVAATRARQLLVWSGYRWDETQRPREPGEYLLEVADRARSGGGTVPVWRDTVDLAAGNPVTATPTRHAWPYDPLTPERRGHIETGARLVGEASTALARGRPPDPAVDAAAAEWSGDVDLLLAERARIRTRRDVVVELPERLSVSQLVQLREDPDALARAIRRPVPRPPNPLARRGTAFHAWLEARYGRPQLLDVDELPGSADGQAAPDADLAALQEAFLASEWSDRQPVEVEVPFELVLAGVVIRGRADAVFPVPDGTDRTDATDGTDAT